MRVKDLQWQECYIWPPEWDNRLKGIDGEWILPVVTLHKDQKPSNFYI